ncbi:MAG: acyltransferase [Chitinophagaceae bacterium]|nr:acyltransferase [Chitinophagaceae bacterium]
MLPANINLKSWFPALDGLRCLAVLLVIFGHWLPIEPYTVFFRVFLPGTGVNLFFVLSGFLITRILLVQKLNEGVKGWPLFRSFYLRRMLRIFPLYFLVLGLGLVLAVPMAREAGWQLASFTLNIPRAGLEFQPADLFNHFWSLCAEEQYYLLFPLLMMIVPARYLRVLFITMLLAGPLSRLLVFSTGYSPYTMEWAANNITVSCFDCFAAGSLLAWYFCYRTEKLTAWVHKPVTGIIIMLTFGVFALLKIDQEAGMLPNLFGRTATALFSCWLIAKVVLPAKKGWDRSWRNIPG